MSCLRVCCLAAIITFHSGEDRRVKNAFREGFRNAIYLEETRDPIVASEREKKDNPRSKSAKLRWVRRSSTPPRYKPRTQ
ncbi:MAG: 16S rRNA (cytosine(1402)-N(4))-methyltransferase [Phycisphaerales bacterium]